MQRRRAARVILVDESGAVLLFRGGDPDRPAAGTWWFTPGGAVESGELAETAAKREVREETGLEVTDLGPVVLCRQVEYEFEGTQFSQAEDYFLVRCEHFDISDSGWTDGERRVVEACGWWSCEALRSTKETVYPDGLATLLKELGISTVDSRDRRAVVREGYNRVSTTYRGDSETPPEHRLWIRELLDHLGEKAEVLDLGCGCGVPVARDLTGAGHHVTGVDFSDVQIARAKQLVPTADFVKADITALEFGAAAFDAVVCLYAIIHLPLEAQAPLIGNIAGWLRPGGRLLLTAGDTAWTGAEDGWLGGDAQMWWSHADRATYRGWLGAAGLEITSEGSIREGLGVHSVFWALRP